MEKKTISRRDFIKGAAVAAGAGVLAACAPQTIIQTQVVEKISTQVVSQVQTQIVEKVVEVTPTPGPTTPPEPVVLDIWWNTTVTDLNAEWKADPNNEVFKKEWYWGGLARVKFKPWLEKHPGVSANISTHSWDSDLRQNQLMALAAGIIPDTTYGEAYVNEFVQLGVYSPLKDEVVKLFSPGTVRGATGKDGKVYGLPKSSGADVLFVHLDKLEKLGLPTDKLPTTWEELVALAKAVSAKNNNPKWGNTAYYTYGPAPTTYGTAMRILHWFNQNDAPLGSDLGDPTANAAKAVDTWLFHNDLMWTSTENLILQAESEAGSGKLFNDGVIVLKPGWNNDATSVGSPGEGQQPVNATAIQFPLPPGGKPATILIGNDMESAFKNGKNPDMAITEVEETVPDEASQVFLADNAGIWIPALASLLNQWETYDKLGGYKTDVAKKIVRITMKTLLDGGAGPIPGWPKNGSQIWAEWNNSYQRIWKGKLKAEDIKKDLDTLQTTITTLLAKTG